MQPDHRRIFDGETYDRTAPAGKTGTATHAVAGRPLTATVWATDAWWNHNTDAGTTPLVSIAMTDPHAVAPAAANLVAGTKEFSVTFRTATSGDWLVTASATDYESGASATGVDPGDAAKLQVLVPSPTIGGFWQTGETPDPGSDTGKTGEPPLDIPAGTTITVTVRAVDAWWNLVSTGAGSVHTVSMSTTDHDGVIDPTSHALVAGTYDFRAPLYSAG